MIKRYFKYFLTFIVIGLGIINFSSAVLEGTGYSYIGELNQPFTQGLYTYNISNTLDFSTSIGNLSKNMFYWEKDNAGYSKYQSYFWYNNYLYTVVGNDDGITFQGYVQNWCITPDFPGIVNGYSSCDGNYSYTLQDIVNINPNFESFTIENLGFTSPTYGVGALQLCFYDGNNYYCVACTPFADRCPSGIITGNVVNISNAKFDSFSYVPFGRSPFTPSTSITGDNVFSSGNVVSIDTDIDDYIEYYESRFGWNERMCYVGTFDLTGSYDDSQIDFYPGSGDTIYGLYYSLYSGFGNNKIKNVGTFINTWLINYGQRFDTVDDDKLYLANYNGPDTSISLYYTGFTDPFSGKPAVIRYMAYNLYNYYLVESTQGEEMIYYCDMKLNYDNYKDGTLNFDELKDSVTPGINKRVKDYVNSQLGGNQDGYQYPSSGSIFDNLVNSGNHIPSDLSPSKLFGDYYSKIDGLVRNFNPVTGTGLIPRRILYPMLFLVLFRIIRH